MYIKKVHKSNRRSGTVYEYLHLVENVRTDKGPRQRLILNLGAIQLAPNHYKELANCIEGLLTGQQSLFSTDAGIEEMAQQAVAQIRAKRTEALPALDQQEPKQYQCVDVDSLEAGQVRSLGAEYVCHCIWNELGFNDALVSCGLSAHVLPLLEALVVGRLVAPGSERYTWQWAQQRSAIFELTGAPLRASLNSLYRAGDQLFACQEALEKHLACREKDLFSLNERMCFFDLTNTYLEGQASANPKAQRGRSKEKRSDCKLLTLALVIDEQGFAKYSRLYPGNQAECHTLEQIIESLIALRPELARERTVIIDAGIATEDNIAYLKGKHFHYIVVSRGKGDFVASDTRQMQVIRQTETYSLQVKRHQADGEVRLLCHSTARQGKDRGIRDRQEKLFIERLQYYHDGLGKKGHTKAYPKVLEMIGRLREKYPRASRFYDVLVIAQDPTAKAPKAKAIIWKQRKHYAQQRQFDGCYVLRTDRLELTDKEIWETYIMLTQVERAFRSLKSALGLRPNFHQLEARADTHMFISVLAYHILHTIEYKLRHNGDHRCWATIRDVLSTHQRLTIEYSLKVDGQRQRHHLRLCSKPEANHKLIYQRLGLKDLPLGKKLYAAK